MRFRARALIGIAVVASAGVARADVGVVVVPARAAPDGEGAVEAAIADALGGAARRRPADDARAALGAGAVRVDELAAFARVRELVDEGWRAYLEVQTEFAVARLGEARRRAEALLPLEGGPAAYAEAALRLGAALDNAGRRAEADDVLRLAARLDPGRAVTVQEFSPDVVAAHRRALAGAPAEQRVRVTGPAGAVVEIDGVTIGPAPAEAAVPAGQHVLVVRGPGRAAAQSFAVGGEPIELAVTLDADADAAALAGGLGRDARAWVDAVVTFADLDALVLASSVWRSRRPALLAQWCDAAASCTGIVEIGYEPGGVAAAARAAIDELRRARGGRRWEPTLPADPRLARGDAPAVTPGCRWCRRALWAGAGVALVALAATVVLFATADDPPPTVTIDPDDFGR